MGTRCIIAVVLAGFVWAACDLIPDRNVEQDGSHRVAIDFSAYRTRSVDGKQFTCATSIDRAILNANDRELVQQVDEDVVIFEIEDLRQGDVRFDVFILSNTGDTLFDGSHSRSIQVDDFGEIDIALNKRLPVLQVCPDSLQLSNDNEFRDAFIVANRDQRVTSTQADSLLWQVIQTQPCGFGTNQQPCLNFEPDNGLVVVPRGEFAWVSWNFESPAGPAGVRFDSETGFAQVQVEVVLVEGPD